MSSANVLPNTPEYSVTSMQNIYLQLPDFRLQKVNEIAFKLGQAITYYCLVSKKYKQVKKVVYWSADGSNKDSNDYCWTKKLWKIRTGPPDLWAIAGLRAFGPPGHRPAFSETHSYMLKILFLQLKFLF